MNIKQSTKIIKKKSGSSSLFSVGIINPGYGYERVSYALNQEGVGYKRLYTLPIYKIMRAHSGFYRETPLVFDAGVDLLHTWNSLPVCRKPFIVSYECELPRYLGQVQPWQGKFGKGLLKSERCRKILALSEAAKNRLILNLEESGDDEIINKVSVFRGGVSLPIPPKKNYSITGPLKLLFVGTNAFRKGIVPLLNACESLIQQGVDIHLTFIGGFNERCYVYGDFIPDIKEIDSLLKEARWVKYMGKVPIDTVFEQMILHDVLAFPTFDESLGWVPIEAGLLGVPTIATDVFALPELIDHEKTGFLIPVDKREDRRFIGLNTVGEILKEHLDKASQDIENGLFVAIKELAENRLKIKQYGQNAKAKLAGIYSPELAAKDLKALYEKSLE